MRGRRRAWGQPLKRGRDALPYAVRARGRLQYPGAPGGLRCRFL